MYNEACNVVLIEMKDGIAKFLPYFVQPHLLPTIMDDIQGETLYKTA